MVDLDIKDQKILYQLDLTSRQSLSQIGKAVRLPKNVVAYRINKLVERGIITNFYTIIDAFRLGYLSVRLYLTYQYTTPSIEQNIVDHFKNNNLTYWIASTEGQNNLVVIMYIKDMNEFSRFWKETLIRYRPYFQRYHFSVYLQLLHYKNSYLLEEYSPKDRAKPETIGCGPPVEIDETDFKILQNLANNSRMPLIEIANKVGATSSTIRTRIKRLEKEGIIQGYRTELDILKLGYRQFKVDINFDDYSKIDAVTRYISQNPHLYYITKTAGQNDFEVTFRVQNIESLHNIMNDLRTKFPKAIKDYNYFYITKHHKLRYMPEQ